MKQSIIKALVDTDLLKVIYKDLAQPGIQQAGKAIGTVLGVVNTMLIAPRILNEKTNIYFNRSMEKYRKKLESISEDDICEVPVEIGVPILEKLSYIRDEDISELFINLLTKASVSVYSGEAHPMFINFINNLSPDEAKILNYLVDKDSFPIINFKLSVEVTIPNPDPETIFYDDTFYKLTGIEKEISLAFPGNMPLYLANLESMGMIICFLDEEFDDLDYRTVDVYLDDYPDKYTDFFAKKYGGSKEDVDCSVFFGRFKITTTGQAFIKACAKNIKTLEIAE